MVDEASLRPFRIPARAELRRQRVTYAKHPFIEGSERRLIGVGGSLLRAARRIVNPVLLDETSQVSLACAVVISLIPSVAL